MIYLLRTHTTEKQLKEMLESLETYIKLAVDIRKGILAGGGELHADCEAVLIKDGSQQENIWGADWIPDTQEIRYEALLNIRPKQGNPSMKLLNPNTREKVKEIAEYLLK
ncbi:MAG: DUF5674 family protein [bacterium]|nr:DUF5674 family protein [bacterium]